MRRSQINEVIRYAEHLFAEHRIALPRFASWSPDDWATRPDNCDEILTCGLGWDITDFGRDDFLREGLLLFTTRNGCAHHATWTKPYAEKIMISRQGQLTLMHCHIQKTEDIINRGGGRLSFELYNRLGEADLADTPVTLQKDGVTVTVPAGERITLLPGESITLEPGVFHKFWAEETFGDVVIGEVSSINDDHHDNVYYQQQRRFPEIIEDQAPYRWLVSDYATQIARR